ncbi:hypothetical protein ACSTD6_16645 [Vibrio vulnificus]|uniref:hypothetical protein n=1 Tax=Vibrio vulnificus TaxID=672 RepID=UPI003EDAE8A9
MNTKSLLLQAVQIERFRETTIESLVVGKCKEAGFVSILDIETRSSRLRWVQKLTERCLFAYAIENQLDGRVEPELNADSIALLMVERDKKVADIMEVIAKKILFGIPNYEG